MISFSGNKAKAFACINGKNVKLKKGYIYENGVFKKLYSAGNIVTYVLDVGVEPVVIEVDEGESCLSHSFVPTKTEWNFVGWRKDTTASGNVETDVTMGDEPITLYAVFKQDIKCTFQSYKSKQYASGTRYYNAAGNTENASIKVPNGAAYSGWTWRGWSYTGQTDANTTVGYANGDVITNVSSAFTLYGLYQQKVTLSYNGNGATSGATSSHSDYRYYNAAGNIIDATFSLKSSGFARTNYSFNGWNLGSPGSVITLSANTTAYAQWVGVPYTWVNNWVGSGAPLSINVETDKWLEEYNSKSYTTNTFKFSSAGEEGDSSYCAFSTNAVETRGLKKMTINFGSDGWWSGTAGGNFKVVSNTGAVLYHVSGEDKSLKGVVTVDVSSASSVYIVGDCGCWAYHGNAYVNVYSISFSN